MNACMEGREGMMKSGVTVIGAEAPSPYHMAPRNENSGHINLSSAYHGPQSVAVAVPSPVSVGFGGTTDPGKKKRGRPRKYAPDGTPAAGTPLSPPPVLSSTPQVPKLGKTWSANSEKKQKKTAMDNSGDWAASSVGTSFAPHVININAGEDVTMKVISFSQQGPRAICILSANGVISNVTLRQPDSSGGTLTYEGRFEILSLSGSFMPTENQGTISRSGGMSVSLASPDGRVVGGSVAGLLVAASPVQVVVGSFLPSNNQEHKLKKPKADQIAFTATQATTMPSSNGESEDSMGPMNGAQHNVTTKPDISSSSPFTRENWTTVHSYQDARKSANTDINISLTEGS